MRALLDLVFPKDCAGCRVRGEHPVCAACAERLPWITSACRRCGMPGAARARCRACESADQAFGSARAAWRYEGVARDVLMTFKLGGERRLARWLGPIMAAARPAGCAWSVVVPVPSTRRSVAARGFDPAAALAAEAAAALGLSCRALLAKVRETRDQSGLDARARRENVRDAFAPRGRAAGAILLVDDVLTTGATADACALTLRRAGATEVGVLTLARAG